MARKRRNDNLIAILLIGGWQPPAIFSVGLFILAGGVHSANPVLAMVLNSLRPAMIAVALALAILAGVKYLLSKRSAKQAIDVNFASAPLHTDKTPVQAKVDATWSIELLHELEWKRFEELATAFYNEKGIKAEATSLGADGGIDIKLYQDDSDKATAIVQCKAWNNLVGVKQIREFLGVMVHEKIAKGFYMTSNGFTEEAKAFAKANQITLVSGEMLLMMILRLPETQQKSLLAVATKGDYKTPTCASCGTKMVARTGKRGKFWGCNNYPKCKQMLHMRAT